MFTELIRENFRSSKLKQCLIPPLGELLYLIATQVKKKSINGVNNKMAYGQLCTWGYFLNCVVCKKKKNQLQMILK